MSLAIGTGLIHIIVMPGYSVPIAFKIKNIYIVWKRSEQIVGLYPAESSKAKTPNLKQPAPRQGHYKSEEKMCWLREEWSKSNQI